MAKLAITYELRLLSYRAGLTERVEVLREKYAVTRGQIETRRSEVAQKLAKFLEDLGYE
jgi:hypothetical protein